ncbi:MAG: TfoX/Sxy family protein [Proteobacteria bacterium]|nr:TfoX/Sxy family protein [Pseudomonadota bacterium]MCH9005541.1 TfoX/Sxy family protein [Pseudomonadota bacterium]
MASDLEFVQYIVDQIDDAQNIRFRKMFGEYALYSNDKVVGLICDNQLFIKPTVAGRSFIGDVVEAPPYPGAKNSFLISDEIDDSEWLTELVRLTEAELPKPKPRKKKRKKR